MSELVYLFILVLVLVSLVVFLNKQKNQESLIEISYANELANLIDNSGSGETINLDVSKAIEISRKNGVNLNEVFSASQNSVCVKLTQYKKTCGNYIRDLEVKFKDEKISWKKDNQYYLEIKLMGRENG